MKKIIIVPAILLISTAASIAQSGIFVSSGASIHVNAGSSLFVDGLVLTPSSNFSIGGANRLVRSTTITNTATGTYVSRVFKWDNQVGVFTGDITFYYLDGELNGLTESSLVLNAHNGSQWMSFSTGVTRSGVGNFVTTPVTNLNFNELTLTSQLDALPLTWGPLKAWRQNDGALVQWITYDEFHTAYFEVERSTDGITWSKISDRIAAFNTVGEHRYHFADTRAATEKMYYRVRQTDLDGKSGYSPVVAIEAVPIHKTVSVYPNPAESIVTIRSNQKIVSITISSIDGRIVKKVSTGGVIAYSLDISGLTAATYVLQLELSDGKFVSEKLIKK